MTDEKTPDDTSLEVVYPSPGGRLEPSDVHGRSAAATRAVRQLVAGRHLLLDEPRRFGKTSFARLVLERLSDSGQGFGVYHSVQGDTTLLKFVESVLGAIRSMPGAGGGAFVDALSSMLSSVGDVTAGPVSLSIAYARDPLAALRDAIANIDKTAETRGHRLVICLDEITETIAEIGRTDSPAAARQLLGELRRLRETHRNISWIFTGSIGFHHVFKAVGTTESMINDMQHFSLGPLDPAWARWLAGSVLLGAEVERSVANDLRLRASIADATDGIPILVHLVGQRVHDHSLQITPENAREILEQCFASADQSRNLTHLLTRLGSYYGPDEDDAARVLDRVARGPVARMALVKEENVDGRLLDSLERDHYLHRDADNRLAWKYPSLARLWTIRRGL